MRKGKMGKQFDDEKDQLHYIVHRNKAAIKLHS